MNATRTGTPAGRTDMKECCCDCGSGGARVFQYRGRARNPRCPGCGQVMPAGQWFELGFPGEANVGVRYYRANAQAIGLSEIMRMAMLRHGE